MASIAMTESLHNFDLCFDSLDLWTGNFLSNWGCIRHPRPLPTQSYDKSDVGHAAFEIGCRECWREVSWYILYAWLSRSVLRRSYSYSGLPQALSLASFKYSYIAISTHEVQELLCLHLQVPLCRFRIPNANPYNATNIPRRPCIQ
jgi:hypothetical protein